MAPEIGCRGPDLSGCHPLAGSPSHQRIEIKMRGEGERPEEGEEARRPARQVVEVRIGDPLFADKPPT